MAHMIEESALGAMMAFAGEVPWHGLGKKVPADLTPEQMLKAAQLDWTVKKYPAYSVLPIRGKDNIIKNTPYSVGWSSLVRESDMKVLDIVSNDWNEVQNSDAADFFHEFVMAGDMEMHTAGCLRDGQVVWFLAKVKDSFDLFKGDQVDSYLLFTNFHKYGHSTDVRFTPIRVVCNNTLTLSLNSKVERMVKMSHRRQFKPEQVKEVLKITTEKLSKYKEMASFLGSRKAEKEDIVEYFKRVFPHAKAKQEPDTKEISSNASHALQILDKQPGHAFAEGSWWQPFNAVTYMTDHLLGRTDDNRLYNSWYGNNVKLKTDALEQAVKSAEKSKDLIIA